jgi:uncharacterized membrane protein
MMRGMSTAVIVFLVLRIAHVLLAAVWLGAVAFVTFFLMPALQETGSAGVPLLSALTRRKVSAFMAAVGGTVVLTGIYLYWRFTAGFDPAQSATHAAMVFGTGGLAGILALIIHGAVVSRSEKRLAILGARLASLPEGPARTSQVADMGAARQRAATFGWVVVVLQVIALACMAVGHYV